MYFVPILEDNLDIFLELYSLDLSRNLMFSYQEQVIRVHSQRDKDSDVVSQNQREKWRTNVVLHEDSGCQKLLDNSEDGQKFGDQKMMAVFSHRF